MPAINSKERAIYVAVSVAACAGCLMGVGSLLLYQRLRRDARGREMVALRRELDDLRRLVESLREFRPPAQSSKPYLTSVAVADDIANQLYQQHVATERLSTESLSSRDDDLAEFYDARSDVQSADYESPVLSNSTSNGHLPSPSGDLELLYRQADSLLAYEKEATLEDRREAYDMMKQHYLENKSNAEFLWRLARTAYLYGRSLFNVDENKRKELCFEAKDYAFEALQADDNDPDVHKWCALTIGTLGDFVSLGQKLKDGWTFKTHIDRAIQLRKNDPTLRHLSGRWLFGVAELSWIERKLASSLFGDCPKATYDEALAEFMEAEHLKPGWKENELYVALCYHNMGNKAEAKRFLEKAREAPSKSLDDTEAEREIEKLWQSYA